MTDAIQQVPQMRLPQQKQETPEPEKNRSYASLLISLLLITLLLLMLVGSGYYLFMKKALSPQATQAGNTPAPAQETPTPQILDTAPALARNQKAQILVHHSDSTYSIYLVPVTSVSAYLQTLPRGDTVVKVIQP